MKPLISPFICVICTIAQLLAFAPSVRSQPVDDPGFSSQNNVNNADPDSDDVDNYDVFYDRLASDGQWLNDDNYGYVFHPSVASTNSWHPYSDGHWVWTDRGWTWVSNENFGWATYHYGRWIRIAGTGWVWVPGTEWAPAWVSWRQTDDNEYCGWAPLPPEATVSANVGVSSWADNYYDIGPAAFTFVRYHDFWRPSYRGYYLPRGQNVTIINRSQNITNITYNNNVIINNGPQFARVSQINAAQGHPLQTYQINYAAQAQRNAAYRTAVQGNQLNVIAPPQNLRAIAHSQPQGVRQLGKAEVQRGWQNVQPAQREQLQQSFAKQAPPPGLPQKPGPPAKPQFVAGKQGPSPDSGQPAKVPPPNAPSSNAPLNPQASRPGPASSAKQAPKPPAKPTAQTQNGAPQQPAGKPDSPRQGAPVPETAHATAPKVPPSQTHKAPPNAPAPSTTKQSGKHQGQNHQAPVNQPHQATAPPSSAAHDSPAHAAQPHQAANHPSQAHPANHAAPAHPPAPSHAAPAGHKPGNAPHHDNSKDKDKKKE